MIKVSRRQLAKYAVNELLNGSSAKIVAEQLAATLIVSKRTNEAEQLVSDVAWEIETRGKLANARVTTAQGLSANLERQLLKFIKQNAKVDEVAMQKVIDKSVIGGIHIETSVHSWDRTLKRKLVDIREAF